jgi:Holliday junction resolvase RusA-like endonuclease
MATELLNFYVRCLAGHGPKSQPSYMSRIIYPRAGKPYASTYYNLREYTEENGKKVRRPWDAERWRDRIIERVRAEVVAVGMKEPIKGPIRLDLDFNFPRPNYMLTSKYSMGRIWYDADKNDRDNLDKLVMDAITQAGWREEDGETVKTPLVWFGDGQVCAGEIQRWYVGRDRDNITGARIIVTRLEDPEPSLLESVSTIGAER